MYGSVQNRMHENAKVDTSKIEVGMGATLCMWSDCEPYTIVEILHFKSGKRAGEVKGVIVQSDKTEHAEGYDYFSNQVYTYKRNKNGNKDIVTIRKNGKWVGSNGNYAIGFRRKYTDPHF